MSSSAELGRDTSNSPNTTTTTNQFAVLTDRSRVIEYQRCPRARWWGYEYQGRGVRPKAASIPLSTGTYVHVGLAELLKGKGVEAAVEAARDGYLAEVGARGLQVDYLTEDKTYVMNEQAALVEAQVRAYDAWQLPRLLEEYDVLEVEQEDLFALTPEIGWQARLDGLLREKASGDLYVLSFKTAASWDRRKESEGRHDMQGLSEPKAVEERLERDWKVARWDAGIRESCGRPCVPHASRISDCGYVVEGQQYIEWLASLPAPPKIQGVKMEFLIKGTRREFPTLSGRYVTYNPLIRAWRSRGITPDHDQYSWKYVNRKGWETFNVWEADDIGGVKGWVEMLKSGRVEPVDEECFPSQFVLNPPYMRLPEETERWERQVTQQEMEVEDAARIIQSLLTLGPRAVDLSVEDALDLHFRQHTRSCDYPTSCDFSSICWGSRTVPELLEEGVYTWREPHHEPEVERMKGWTVEGGR